MKFLLITPCKFASGYADIKEFASERELSSHIEMHGFGDSILARRMGIDVKICDWTPGAAEEKTDVAL